MLSGHTEIKPEFNSKINFGNADHYNWKKNTVNAGKDGGNFYTDSGNVN